MDEKVGGGFDATFLLPRHLVASSAVQEIQHRIPLLAPGITIGKVDGEREVPTQRGGVMRLPRQGTLGSHSEA
jgi:hypothetical protein